MIPFGRGTLRPTFLAVPLPRSVPVPTLSRIVTALTTTLLLAACADVPQPPTAPSATAPSSAEADLVRDRYIVVFNDSVHRANELSSRLIARFGGKLHFQYEHALKGFAATLSPTAVEALRRDPSVAYVERDAIAHALTIEMPAPWSVDRIDQINLPLDNQYSYGGTGAGVRAYVIDTGIAREDTLAEFQHRVIVGFDNVNYGPKGQDCHGHGTRVAGAIGSTTYGVAKGVTIVVVRVLNCGADAPASNIISGIDWVVANHVSPAVANISIGIQPDAAFDDAVRRLVASGVTTVVGAGNDGTDACNITPARVSEAITVGATATDDSRVIHRPYYSGYWTSNYGPCVDLFAPGDSIPTTDFGNRSTVESGTSMSSPLVAGVAARYLAVNPTATPASVASYILGQANNKVLNAGPGSPTKLLFMPSGVRVRPCC
jgi:subtilisin family serine protease